jgi:hypothetical protein
MIPCICIISFSLILSLRLAYRGHCSIVDKQTQKMVSLCIWDSRRIFRTNHASNYLPLAGTLPQDKERLLATLDGALAQGESALRPEGWRGL